jgi:hypothetical protein
MLGFLFGTVCLIALVKVARRRRYGASFGCAGGHGPGFGPFGFGRGRWGRGAPFADFGYGPDFGPEDGYGPDFGDPYADPHAERFGGGGFDGWPARGRRPFFRAPWQMALEAIRPTPDQRKAISGAFDELRRAGAKAREQMRDARKEVARLVRQESLDEVGLGELSARWDEGAEALRKAGVSALASIHSVLDEGQRQRLAELVERGPRFWARASRGGAYG